MRYGLLLHCCCLHYNYCCRCGHHALTTPVSSTLQQMEHQYSSHLGDGRSLSWQVVVVLKMTESVQAVLACSSPRKRSRVLEQRTMLLLARTSAFLSACVVGFRPRLRITVCLLHLLQTIAVREALGSSCCCKIPFILQQHTKLSLSLLIAVLMNLQDSCLQSYKVNSSRLQSSATCRRIRSALHVGGLRQGRTVEVYAGYIQQ